MTPSAPSVARRDFLKYTTLGTAALGGGLAAKGIFGAMATSADVAFAARPHAFDLSTLDEGKVAKIILAPGMIVQILHRTQAQIDESMAVPPNRLPDPQARNLNFPNNSEALATDENRRATPDGRFVAVVGICPHFGVVILGEVGDFGAWFCPVCSTHFDSAGRPRKGYVTRNLVIPAMNLVAPSTLLIYQNPRQKPLYT